MWAESDQRGLWAAFEGDMSGVPPLPLPPSPALPVSPVTPEEREDVEADLADLEVYQNVLESRGLMGLAVDCEGCRETHYFSWSLVRSNLEALLGPEGEAPAVHEPACNPDVNRYATWDYARGFVDGLLAGSRWDGEGPAR